MSRREGGLFWTLRASVERVAAGLRGTCAWLDKIPVAVAAFQIYEAGEAWIDAFDVIRKFRGIGSQRRFVACLNLMEVKRGAKNPLQLDMLL